MLSRNVADPITSLENKIRVNQQVLKSPPTVVLLLLHWWGVLHGFSSVSHPGLNTGPLAPCGTHDCWVSEDSGTTKRRVIPPLTYSEMRSRLKPACTSQEAFLCKSLFGRISNSTELFCNTIARVLVLASSKQWKRAGGFITHREKQTQHSYWTSFRSKWCSAANR